MNKNGSGMSYEKGPWPTFSYLLCITQVQFCSITCKIITILLKNTKNCLKCENKDHESLKNEEKNVSCLH